MLLFVLERNDGLEDIEKYELEEVTLNVLRIERTFIDKLMSVKRHAICGTIEGKVRHIYDVTRMFSMEEIQSFLRNEEELKRLVQITKSTDAFYLQKRGVTKEYDPTEPYEFEAWRHYLTSDVCSNYENLHKDLLYTDEKQNFDLAIDTFSKMSSILKRIGE